MDSNTLKVLLDSQNQSFRGVVDNIVDQFKSRITNMETKLIDLTRSLEYTQAEVTDLRRANKSTLCCHEHHGIWCGWRAAASEPGSANTAKAARGAPAGVGGSDTVRPAAGSRGTAGSSDGSASTGRGEEAASTVETGTRSKKDLRDRKKK
ncbi:hypothetical protein Pcinc_025843 [Petrolisthes cinctipes]|uniref:Uncharacterized protein n=1 Tax=Petrolisthes cinctipes TaxID=88211 RepID=A0AAE1F8G5_PETCI|nr:hypothetical protein Pcinc_025843 [Petrolisthes cinctipes]